MKRNNALSILRELKPTLVQQFGVNQLALIDFTALDDARDNSDEDILVGFDGPATSTRYFGVQFYVEDQPGCPVGLVTDKALRPELRPFFEKDAINV